MAVDSAGKIYVADAGKGQINIFAGIWLEDQAQIDEAIKTDKLKPSEAMRMLDEYEELRAECTRLALLQKGTDAEQWKRQALDVGGERNALHTRLSEVEGERDKYAKLHASALGSLMLAETVLSVIAGKACACSKLAAAAIGQLDFDASSIDAALKVG